MSRDIRGAASRLCRLTILAAVLNEAAAGLTLAQSAPTHDTSHAAGYRGRLLGLFDQTTGQPIEGAEVFDVSTGWSAKTTATGTVSLVFLPDGGGLVRIRKVGYAPVFVRVAISPRDTAPITLLVSRLTELPAVVTHDTVRRNISGNLNAFDERARLRITGYFITDTLLRKSENRTLANLIRSQFPNALIREGAFSQAYLAGGRPCTGPPPEVFVDGVPMNSPGTGSGGRSGMRIPAQQFNLNSIQISDLQGAEYYPSGTSVPAEFTSERTGCGALMLWTRER